jgi:hypothetical protein
MVKPVLPKTPSPADAAKAWTKGFAAAARKAAGESERLTPAKAEAMAGPYADNVRNYFERTGKSWANVDTVIASAAEYAQKSTKKAAGGDNKLSLTDMRALPKDMVDDMLALRGKKPVGEDGGGTSTTSLDAALKAADIPTITDYGKHVGLSTYPKSKSREDILRDVVGYDDLTDAEVSDWFSSTKGAAAVAGFKDAMVDVGASERENADEDDGETGGKALERIFRDVGKATVERFSPVSQFKSVEYVEHYIQEDGDCEYRVLLAQKKDDSWVVLSYSDFPF